MADTVGVYVCLTQGCGSRNREVQHAWDESWPLERRRKRCGSCRRPMLLCAVKRPMSATAKRRLQELAASRKAKA